MNRIIVIMLCIAGALRVAAQDTDSIKALQTMYVYKDSRLDIIGKKEAELNALAIKLAARSAIGYRLQVLSTNDRELAMKTKSQLLQQFPEQKVYMLFQSPYLKIRFGNFKSKQEAVPYKNQISRMLGGASVYYVSERIEVKPEKDSKDDDK